MLIFMPLNKCVLHPDCLAKYAAAFFRMSRSSVTRLSSTAQAAHLVGLRALRLELVRGHLPGLDPLIQAVLADAKPGRHLDHLVASFGDLLGRFGLEFFGASLLAHSTSY